MMKTRAKQHDCRWPLAVARAIFSIILLLVSPTLAQDTPLTASVSHVGYRSRTASPSVVDITLQYTGSTVLTGRLRVQVVGLDPLAIITTSDIALIGKRDLRVMLPPLPPVVGQRNVDLMLSFETEGGTHQLGTHTLPVPDISTRGFVIAVCDPLASAIDRRFGPVAMSLALEKYRPDNTRPGNLRTVPAMIDPARMPTQPLVYCGYDIVLLTPESFAQLESAQLDALLAWTQAGGSVLVFTGSGAAFESKHLDFLSSLVAQDTALGAVRLSPEGKLILASGETPKLVTSCRSELGRAVIVFGDNVPDATPESEAWRSVVAWLWKMREEPTIRMAQRGTWGWRKASDIGSSPDPGPTFAPEERERYRDDPYERIEENPVAPRIAYDLSEIMEMLMPDDVTVMPFGFVVLLLLTFVVAIGPVDYFVLGWLKMRKWTWVSFPLVAIVFTWLTLQLANHYMGQTGKGKSLTMVDVGSRGQVLRSTTIQLQFSPREFTLTRELTGELFIPMNQVSWDYYGAYYDESESDYISAPLYAGNLPGKHTVTTLVRQWTPRMNRITSIARGEVALDIDWEAGRKLLGTRGADARSFRAAMLGGRQDEARVAVFAQGDVAVIDADTNAWLMPQGNRYRRHQYYDGPRSYEGGILSTLGGGSHRGFFEYVSHISPTGSDNLEDLNSYERDDKGRLVMVITRDDEGVTIYRRYFPRSD